MKRILCCLVSIAFVVCIHKRQHAIVFIVVVGSRGNLLVVLQFVIHGVRSLKFRGKSHDVVHCKFIIGAAPSV